MPRVSPSVFISCWHTDEPAATDLLERRTWAGLRLVVQGRCVTQFWDRRANAESETIYVPAFALARWIVSNWWALFYEPCTADRPPAETDRWSTVERRWIRRHCLRSAESGLFLPYVHFYSNGPSTSIAWFADDAFAYPSMPGYFLYDGQATLETRDVMAGMSEFVAKVLGWCEGLEEPRVDQLRADWSAITDMDMEELEFCRAAGRMGLDPFSVETWEPGLVEFLSADLGSRVNDDIVVDLLESAEPASAVELWRWITSAERTFGLRAGAIDRLAPVEGFRTAKDQGYDVARRIRQIAGLGPTEAIDDLASVARAVGGMPFSFRSQNHLPGRAVLAAAGWSADGEIVIAGPRPPQAESARFLESRGLYHALLGCRRGARLVTRAHTWDQQATRAFAAELLAPQAALCERARRDMEPDERLELQQELASEFRVSTEVIRLQLRNAGVWREI